MEGCLRKYLEDHIAGKGINSLSRNNLVREFVLMPQGNEDTRCTSSSG